MTEFVDYGWAGWQPSPDKFCLEVLPQLEAMGVNISGEVRNDCDPGDKQYITNATQLQCERPHDPWSKIGCSPMVFLSGNVRIRRPNMCYEELQRLRKTQAFRSFVMNANAGERYPSVITSVRLLILCLPR